MDTRVSLKRLFNFITYDREMEEPDWKAIATQRYSAAFPLKPNGTARKPDAARRARMIKALKEGKDNLPILREYEADPGLLTTLGAYVRPATAAPLPTVVAAPSVKPKATVKPKPNTTKKNRVISYENAKSPARREYFNRYGKNPPAAVLAKLQKRHSFGNSRNNVYAEVNAILAKKGIAPAAAKTAAAAAEAAVNAVAENAAATAAANVLGTATALPAAPKKTRKRVNGKVAVMTKEQAIAKAREEYFGKYGRFPKLDRLTKLWPRFYYGESRNNLYATYGRARGNATVRAPRTTLRNTYPFARPDIRGPSQFERNRAALTAGPLSTIEEVNETNSGSASASAPYVAPKTAKQILADNAARVTRNFETSMGTRPSAIQITQLVKAARANAKAGTTTYKNVIQRFKNNRKTKKQTSAYKAKCAKACQVCRECDASPEMAAAATQAAVNAL